MHILLALTTAVDSITLAILGQNDEVILSHFSHMHTMVNKLIVASKYILDLKQCLYNL